MESLYQIFRYQKVIIIGAMSQRPIILKPKKSVSLDVKGNKCNISIRLSNFKAIQFN